MAIDVNKIQLANAVGGGGATTCKFNTPFDTQPDDLFIFFAAGCASGPDAPFDDHEPIIVSGAGGDWTEVTSGEAEYIPDDGGTGLLLSIWWAKGLTANALVEASCAPGTLMWSSCIARVSGSAAAPVNAVGAFGVGNNADPSTVTAPSITPTADDVIVFYFMAEADANSTSFQDATPTGWTRLMFQVTNVTAFAMCSMLAMKGGDTSPTGAATSQPIAKEGVDFNPRPVAIQIAVARGGCVDGTCPFLSTDGVASEGP